jgi:hypothetical protein
MLPISKMAALSIVAALLSLPGKAQVESGLTNKQFDSLAQKIKPRVYTVGKQNVGEIIYYGFQTLTEIYYPVDTSKNFNGVGMEPIETQEEALSRFCATRVKDSIFLSGMLQMHFEDYPVSLFDLKKVFELPDKSLAILTFASVQNSGPGECGSASEMWIKITRLSGEEPVSLLNINYGSCSFNSVTFSGAGLDTTVEMTPDSFYWQGKNLVIATRNPDFPGGPGPEFLLAFENRKGVGIVAALKEEEK